MLFANMQLLGRCPMESHTFAMNLKCRHIWTWQTFPCIPKPRSICYSWMMYMDPPIRLLQKSSSTRLATRPLAKKIDQGMFMTGTLWWKYLAIPLPISLMKWGRLGSHIKVWYELEGWYFGSFVIFLCHFAVFVSLPPTKAAERHVNMLVIDATVLQIAFSNPQTIYQLRQERALDPESLHVTITCPWRSFKLFFGRNAVDIERLVDCQLKCLHSSIINHVSGRLP